MDLKDFIKNSMRDHRYYANSFTKLPSISNEHAHPKTGKRLSYTEMSWLIEQDAEKRAKAIIKRISQAKLK